MAYQAVFERYELKYMLTLEQKARILDIMKLHMALDQYGRDIIRNLYYDTDNYRLIRQSIEKPAYKEKLRMRSYRKAGPDSPVYVEMKKKHQSIVYKRRMVMPERDAVDWLADENRKLDSQISKEIDYFMKFYGTLKPRVFLSYEREAYYALDGSDFRVTFDENILCREEEVSLSADVYGTSLLDENQCLMEIKCAGGIPMWMTEVLSKEKLYKTSFSKYGTYYMNYIYPRLIQEAKNGNNI